MSADPFPGYVQWPQTQNLYVYVTNNPVNLIDPAGLDEHDYYIFVQGSWHQTGDAITKEGDVVTADPGGVIPWLNYLRMSLPPEYWNDDVKWETWKNEHVLLVSYEAMSAAEAAEDLFERVKKGQTSPNLGKYVEEGLRKEDLKDYGFSDRQGKIRLFGHSFGGVVAMEFAMNYADRINLYAKDAEDVRGLLIGSVTTIDSPLKGCPYPITFDRYREEQIGTDEFGQPIHIRIDRIEEFARLHPEITLLTVSNEADAPVAIGHDPIPGCESGYMPGYKYIMDKYLNQVPTPTGTQRYYNDYGFYTKGTDLGRMWAAVDEIHRRVMEEDTLVRWWVNRYGGLY